MNFQNSPLVDHASCCFKKLPHRLVCVPHDHFKTNFSSYRGHLSISLFFVESVSVILEDSAIKQTKVQSSLANSNENFSSSSDSSSLDEAITVTERILLTHVLLLFFQQTVLSHFEAKVVPLLHPDDLQLAPKWNIEAQCLVFSQD